MKELIARASKNFDKYLRDFMERGERNLLPIGRLSESEWKQLSAYIRPKYGVALTPVVYKGIRYMGFIKRDENSVDILNEYTGRKWEYKEKSGLGYSHYRIPLFDMNIEQARNVKSMLSALGLKPEIESTNKGVFLVVRAENMPAQEKDKEPEYVAMEYVDPESVEPMAYGYAPAIDVDKNANVAPVVDKNITNIGHNLYRYTGYDWEHKTESGLGYEHYRLPVAGMPKTEINRITSELEKRAIYPELVQLNKGTFLIFNTDKVRSRRPEKYHGGQNMLNNNYNASVAKQLSPEIKKELQDIVNTPLPPGREDIHSPNIIAHTARIINAYAQAGALDLNGVNKMAYDLRRSVMAELARMPDIVNDIKNWGSIFMTKEKKKELIKKIHYIIGGINRKHDGNTIVLMGDKYYAGGGFNGSGSNSFGYSTYSLSDFDYVFGVVIHENVHGFQKYNRTSFSKDVYDYVKSICEKTHQHYVNRIDEAESRYIQDLIAKDFRKDFLAYVTTQEHLRSGDKNR